MTRITGFDTFDIRFPTSRTLAGSDAMNPAPHYSAAYVVIRTDAADPALSGHGFAFTIGRGNDVQLAAIRLLEHFAAPAVVTGGRYRARRCRGPPPRSCRSRWRSTATRPARRGAAAGCSEHGPRPPSAGAHRRTLRAGRRRGGRGHWPRPGKRG